MTADPLVPAESLLDADGYVAVDTPCLSCGYNLRSLPAAGLCPECARPVEKSLQGDRLCFASPVWVKRLARGTWLTLIATLMTLAAVVVSFVGLILMSFSAGPNASAVWLGVGGFLLLMAALGLAVFVLLILGLVFLTCRDPASGSRPEGFSARRLVRVLMWMPAIALVFNQFSRRLFPLWSFGASLSASANMSQVVSLILWALAYFVLPLTLLLYLAKLMRRVPRAGLVLFCRIEFWGFLATGVATIVGYIIFTYATMAMRPAFMAAAASAPTSMSVNIQQVPTYGVAPRFPPGYTGAGVSASAPTTTMPSTVLPPFGPWFAIGSGLTGLGSCSSFAVVVAGFVLLILVQRALAQAAKEAAQNAVAADPPGSSPGPESPSPRFQA